MAALAIGRDTRVDLSRGGRWALKERPWRRTGGVRRDQARRQGSLMATGAITGHGDMGVGASRRRKRRNNDQLRDAVKGLAGSVTIVAGRQPGMVHLGVGEFVAIFDRQARETRVRANVADFTRLRGGDMTRGRPNDRDRARTAHEGPHFGARPRMAQRAVGRLTRREGMDIGNARGDREISRLVTIRAGRCGQDGDMVLRQGQRREILERRAVTRDAVAARRVRRILDHERACDRPGAGLEPLILGRGGPCDGARHERVLRH